MDSLELLLDTICNTFGAVIFISMLVAVLVARSRSPVTPPEEPVTSMVDSAQQQERLSSLQRLLRQQELIRSELADESAIELALQIRDRKKQLPQLQEQNDASRAALRLADSEMQKSQETLSDAEQQVQSAQQVNDTLRQQIQRLIQLKARTARIPAVRRTGKESVVFALQDGKLYRVTTPGQLVDTVDCQRSVVNNLEAIRPRKAAGLVVAKARPRDVSGKFQGMSTSKHFAQIFVSPNSFEAFLPIKDAVVSAGLEYEVKVSDTDQVELFLGSARQESFVQ